MSTRAQWGEKIALGFAAVSTAAALAIVPSWQGSLIEICRVAGVFAGVSIVALFVARFRGRSRIPIERATAALFLAGMPFVYVIRWLEAHGGGAPAQWLWVELAGIPIFAGLAALGLKRSPWFLVAGIAAHGIAWDAWHWLLGSAYMFDWFSMGCLLCDVSLGLYLAFRIPDWYIWRLERASRATAPSPHRQLPSPLP